jgi:hypothetical protein
MHAFGPRGTVTLRCWLCNGCRPSPETLSVTSAPRRATSRLVSGQPGRLAFAAVVRQWISCGPLWMPMPTPCIGCSSTGSGLGTSPARHARGCCYPPPFNWESYTYTAPNGRSWTWDIACARALVARRSMSERLTLEPMDVHAWLASHGQVNEQHLGHIPLECLEEPVLLAAVPDGQGHVMIDGSHRVTIRTRSGLHAEGFLLSAIESSLAIGTVPLAMRRTTTFVKRIGRATRPAALERRGRRGPRQSGEHRRRSY